MRSFKDFLITERMADLSTKNQKHFEKMMEDLVKMPKNDRLLFRSVDEKKNIDLLLNSSFRDSDEWYGLSDAHGFGWKDKDKAGAKETVMNFVHEDLKIKNPTFATNLTPKGNFGFDQFGKIFVFIPRNPSNTTYYYAKETEDLLEYINDNWKLPKSAL